MADRRFGPLFWTQFLGAANDNLFKFAIAVLLTYRLHTDWLPPSVAGLVIGGVFILPFVLFSATSGQLADRLEKAELIRHTKWLELAVMALGAWALHAGQVGLLLVCLFLMGAQSTLFGPLKYAYLPQRLHPQELVAGNAWVEAGTFLAILLGNLAGGLLVALPQGQGLLREVHWVGLACVGLAALGLWAACHIPPAESPMPGLRISWNPLPETWATLQAARRQAGLWRALLSISWLWLLGGVMLGQFPAFAREVLRGDESVASLLLVLFSVGVGLGSGLGAACSRQRLNLRLAFWGLLGMAAAALDLGWSSASLPAVPGTVLRGLADWVSMPGHARVMADLLALAVAAGVFSLPVYTQMQLEAPESHRARVVAANNILNALFMVASALLAGVLLSRGLSQPGLFGLLGLGSLAWAAWLWWVEPRCRP